MSGLFIVIDGPDGSGSTRHCEFLSERLKREGYTVCRTAEPTSNRIGSDIRAILKTPPLPDAAALQLLFCADRAQHVAETITPALERGEIVVCDRYRLSTIVYGAAQGVDADWLRAVNDHFPAPDVTILTLPSLEVCLERLRSRSDNDAFEHEELQRAVYEQYTSAQDGPTHVIDTSIAKDEAAAAVWSHVAPLLKKL